MITIALLIVVVSLLAYVYYWAKNINETWNRRGVKHRKPVLFFGNIVTNLVPRKEQKHLSILLADICKDFPEEPLVG